MAFQLYHPQSSLSVSRSTTRTCGSKLLLCCVRRRDCFEDGETGTPFSIGVSQTTTFSACGEAVLCSRSAIAILAESVTPWAPARTHKKRVTAQTKVLETR